MTFRIGTWNLDHASNKSRFVAGQLDRIESINADIWVLTETCDRADLSPLGYRCATPFRRNKYGNFWTTVWARSPFVIVQQFHACDDETVTCVEVETAGGPLLVYGTILTWQMDRGPNGDSRPWEEHHKAIGAHGDDWFRMRALDPDRPLVVAGDFNQTRDESDAYCSASSIELLSRELTRSNLVCVTEEDFGKNGKLHVDPKKGRYRHNIDHICLTPSRLEAVHVGAWDHFDAEKELSDHNGVFADVMWRSK